MKKLLIISLGTAALLSGCLEPDMNMLMKRANNPLASDSERSAAYAQMAEGMSPCYKVDYLRKAEMISDDPEYFNKAKEAADACANPCYIAFYAHYSKQSEKAKTYAEKCVETMSSNVFINELVAANVGKKAASAGAIYEFYGFADKADNAYLANAKGLFDLKNGERYYYCEEKEIYELFGENESASICKVEPSGASVVGEGYDTRADSEPEGSSTLPYEQAYDNCEHIRSKSLQNECLNYGAKALAGSSTARRLETLAKIYTEQGMYKKAAEAYEKVTLENIVNAKDESRARSWQFRISRSYLKVLRELKSAGKMTAAELFRLGRLGNNEEALWAYSQACEMNHAGACNNLGLKYEDGRGMKLKDKTIAAKFYKKACDLNDEVGCANLARLYENGQGVVRNYNTAKALYKKACGLGRESACKRFNELEDIVINVEK